MSRIPVYGAVLHVYRNKERLCSLVTSYLLYSNHFFFTRFLHGYLWSQESLDPKTRTSMLYSYTWIHFSRFIYHVARFIHQVTRSPERLSRSSRVKWTTNISRLYFSFLKNIIFNNSKIFFFLIEKKNQDLQYKGQMTIQIL